MGPVVKLAIPNTAFPRYSPALPCNILVTAAAISFQALRAALEKPVKALRSG
ncbi:MAG TPA: hypothetical protein VG605_12865 [Puia sp.]|nr:hypothetical protein [Puia sp.]